MQVDPMATTTQQFRAAVARLALPAADQREYLTTLGVAPLADELALEFSDALLVVKEDIGSDARSLATRIDQLLDEMSGPPNQELWTIDALHTAEEWARLRVMSGDLLRMLGDADS